MSHRLVKRVLATDLLPTPRLVLIVLAEAANDAGWNCWLSIATIATRSGLSERSVQRAISELEQARHLTRHYRTGASTQYHVHPRQADTPTPVTVTPPPPSERHPRQGVGGDNDDANPRQGDTLTMRTTIRDKADALSQRAREKPAKPKKRKPDSPSFWRNVPEWVPLEPWQRFLKHRRDIRQQVTAHSAKLLLNTLDRLRSEGHDPGAVLDQSTENSWTALYALKSPRSNADGKPTRHDPADDAPRNAFVRAALERQAERAAGST